jgi:hypothetical protein
VPQDTAIRGREQPAEHPQQAGLTASIGPHELKAVPRPHSKTEIPEKPAAAAHALEAGGFQHYALPAVRFRFGSAEVSAG